MTAITLNTLAKLCAEGEKFCCLTAYDASFAELISSQGVEILLVGDSLGMVIQGQDSTLSVSMADMAYHTRAVKAGNQGSLIMADMPFMSAQSIEVGLVNAAELMRAGAHLVKIEGGAWLAPLVQALKRNGVPSCVHLGLTPQSVNTFGGYRVQGRSAEQAAQLLADAKALVAAGAAMLLLECVPADLAKQVVAAVDVPVIGIGAGGSTQGQVLVSYDMLGLGSGRKPRFVRDFLATSNSLAEAVSQYVQAVKSGQFPSQEHEF